MRAVPPSRYIAFFTVAVGGCALDLATKSWIFGRLGMPQRVEPWWIWPKVIGFQTSLNEGALFGMGQGMVPVFSAISVVAALGILWWLFWAGAARQWILTIALACIMAGIFGNLYDRLGLPGLVWNYPGPMHAENEPVRAVRDWILVMFGTWPWPTFNIADALLDIGAVLIVWHAFWFKPEQGEGSVEKAKKKGQA